jgi:hypothetical protein
MFTIVSTLILAALMLMWRTTDPVNLTIKFGLFAVVLWGIYNIATGAI